MINIGIDPDTEKSGSAVWSTTEKAFKDISTLAFFDLIALIERYNEKGFELIVFIEAGWLIKKSNWHVKKGQKKSVGEKIAKDVGANHQVGKLIAEYCENKKITYALIKPQGKKNKAEFKRITGWEKVTNPEKRDAAMLVFGR